MGACRGLVPESMFVRALFMMSWVKPVPAFRSALRGSNDNEEVLLIPTMLGHDNLFCLTFFSLIDKM